MEWWATWWSWAEGRSRTLFDEAELEALIGTIVDVVAGRPAGIALGDLAKPVEPESTGFIYLPEGVSLTPTVRRGEPLDRSATTTWYSSSSEGFTTTTNDV